MRYHKYSKRQNENSRRHDFVSRHLKKQQITSSAVRSRTSLKKQNKYQAADIHKKERKTSSCRYLYHIPRSIYVSVHVLILKNRIRPKLRGRILRQKSSHRAYVCAETFGSVYKHKTPGTCKITAMPGDGMQGKTRLRVLCYTLARCIKTSIVRLLEINMMSLLQLLLPHVFATNDLEMELSCLISAVLVNTIRSEGGVTRKMATTPVRRISNLTFSTRML